MSEDDSRTIVDSSFGSRITPAGTEGPSRCGYYQRDTGQATVLLPDSADGGGVAAAPPFVGLFGGVMPMEASNSREDLEAVLTVIGLPRRVPAPFCGA